MTDGARGHTLREGEAEQVVGVVGASNMFAAYFLGQIELIGGKP